MLNVSTTVKRLAMALLGACLLMLGTPLLSATPANAGTAAGPVTLSFMYSWTRGNVKGISTADNTPLNIVINATDPGPGYRVVWLDRMATVHSEPPSPVRVIHNTG